MYIIDVVIRKRGVNSSLAGDLVVSQQTILYNIQNNEAQKEISKVNSPLP